MSSKTSSSKKSLSRKSSSRKSSSKSSLSNNEFEKMFTNSVKDSVDPSFMIFFVIFGLTYNMMLIYYLNNLQDANCDCVIDWRYYLVKYMSVFGILTTILFLFFKIDIFYSKNNILKNLYSIIMIVNVYAFFTYIRDLKKTQCSCAVSKQINLTSFFHIMSYILFFVVIVLTLLLIIV